MRQVAYGLVLFTVLASTACADGNAVSPATLKLLKTFDAEFVLIEPGKGRFPATFELGSKKGPEQEQPAVTITLTEPFAIGKYEVPQNLYEAVMGNNPSRWKGVRNSVEMMTFPEALEFCERTTKLMRQANLLGEDEEIRLPSEVEWEYCCRAGTTTAYSFGDAAQGPDDAGKKATLLDPYAWHTGNAAGNDPPVGALKPNPWGLYDMHGYLWEFCRDDFIESYESIATTGAKPRLRKNGDACVIRGGSWKDEFVYLRSAARRGFNHAGKDDAIGFRCVKAKVD
ncbi:MAG: formylglycine-generating enzyme family protein [Planctomycetaceae bacterium]